MFDLDRSKNLQGRKQILEQLGTGIAIWRVLQEFQNEVAKPGQTAGKTEHCCINSRCRGFLTLDKPILD